jgi:hypothetical protein
MNNSVKKFVVFAIGAIIGGGASYIFVKKQVEEEMVEITEELEEYRDRRRFSAGGIDRSQCDDFCGRAKNSDQPVGVFHTPDEEAEYQETLEGCGYVENPPDVDDCNTFIPSPYIIDQQTFVEDVDECEKLSLTYYTNEDILLDDHQEIVPDRESIIGSNAFLDCFGFNPDDQDVVYVRNEQLGIDFEIIRVLPPYKPQKPKRRRRSNAID